MYDVMLVSWATKLYMFRFVPSNHSVEDAQLIYMFNHDEIIYNMEYLNENVFVTLDGHQVFRTIRFDVTNAGANVDAVSISEQQEFTPVAKRDRSLPIVSHMVINSTEME